MAEDKRVVIAMSGGVDSSVAAALLKQQGYDVIGMMLRLWSEPGKEDSNRCCTPAAMGLARRVAAQLDIPFYVIDAKQEFRQTVVQYFIDGYTQGVTPNPCMVCNRHIRFRLLLDQALALGADFLATGHYAQSREVGDGSIQLLRAEDAQKDQSYILHILNQQQLSHALFPIGRFQKSQVRDLARQLEMPISERPDSQDLCFLAGGDYRQFLMRNAPAISSPGRILNRNGDAIGRHSGLAFYTIGQRKGLGLSSPHPLYVIDKDIERNTLIVGTADEMGSTKLLAADINWISGAVPAAAFLATVKIRYKARDIEGVVTPLPGRRAAIEFSEPLRSITPGQAAVFYDGEVCLGGGIIMIDREGSSK